MDDTLMKTMLFDFYGELLTEKQREYYDLHCNNDLSLGEIAEQTGTTRQAVWDIITRAERTLRDTEEKTGLVRRFMAQRELLREAVLELEALLSSGDGSVRETAGSVMEKLRALED